MTGLKKLTGLAAMAFVLCLAGCSAPDDNNSKEKTVFSYAMDELAPFFNTDEKTVTLNRWFLVNVNLGGKDYDTWARETGNDFFKDKALTQKYLGSDLVQANTVIYSDFSLNGQGPKIGAITGTVKLTGFPSEKFKLFLYANGKNWRSQGKVTLINPVEENRDMDWSFPVYDKQVNSWGTWGFEPSDAEFTLLVLPETAKKGYEVAVPTKKMINSANEDIGSLDTVSVKGVKLSGIINVTHNGQPVPYVEINAVWEVKGILETIYLLSPGPDEPWSIYVEKSNAERDITFRVYGWAKQHYTTGDFLFDRYAQIEPLIITSNDVTDIEIDLNNE